MVAKDKELPGLFEPREDLVQAAKKVAVGIAGRASEADRERRVPVENIQDLHEAGLLSIAIPCDLGETEADLVTQNAVYEIIGGARASTAWVMGNHSVLCTRSLGMMGEGAHALLRDVCQNGSLISHAAVPWATPSRRQAGLWPRSAGLSSAVQTSPPGCFSAPWLGATTGGC